jgi:hypothetical protein
VENYTIVVAPLPIRKSSGKPHLLTRVTPNRASDGLFTSLAIAIAVDTVASQEQSIAVFPGLGVHSEFSKL